MRQEWEPVTTARLLGFGTGMCVFFWLVYHSEPGFIFLLDHANLLFHEAGHPLVGVVSRRLEPYGGTIGQLVFPCVLAASFWRKAEPLGVACAGVWFSENLFNIARYLADARSMELPLVGGGDHDWNTILGRWDLLRFDTQIAGGLKVCGWVGIALVCAWVSYRAWQTKRNNRPVTEAQHRRFAEWLNSLARSSGNLAVIELGAGSAIPTEAQLRAGAAKPRWRSDPHQPSRG